MSDARRPVEDWLSGDARRLMLCAEGKLILHDSSNVVLQPNVWLTARCVSHLQRITRSTLTCTRPSGHTGAHQALDQDELILMFWDQWVYWPPT